MAWQIMGEMREMGELGACPMLGAKGMKEETILDAVVVARRDTYARQRHTFRDHRPLSVSSTGEKVSQAYTIGRVLLL